MPLALLPALAPPLLVVVVVLLSVSTHPLPSASRTKRAALPVGGLQPEGRGDISGARRGLPKGQHPLLQMGAPNPLQMLPGGDESEHVHDRGPYGYMGACP